VAALLPLLGVALGQEQRPALEQLAVARQG
jgi:hypothetical protein